jgi:hypothetical protein
MKKLAIWCGLAAIAGAAFFVRAAGAWELIASYPTPGADPRGYYLGDLNAGWIVDAAETPYAYHVYWPSASIAASFPAPGGAGAWGVCGRPGGNLYFSNNVTSYVYQTTTAGSVVTSFPCPVAGPADMGYAYPGPYLYIAIPDRNVIAVVNPGTGSLASSFRAPGSRPTACCSFGACFRADSATHTIYYDGSPIITTVQTPTGLGELSTTVDATFLHVADDATDRVYVYRSGAPVSPASLGRVKALFR